LFLAFYVSSISFWDNLSFILSIWFPYWLLKCIMSFVNTPFVYLWVKYLKNNK
jgi:uncharacterized PurR-regulated membrane protein YhhQ (DUF165 family)